MKNNLVCSIDFETGSRADLKKCGAARYSEDPSTRALCLAYLLPGKTLKVWREGEPFPRGLIDWVLYGGLLSGWNVLFEFYIWNNVLRRQCPGEKIPRIVIPQLIDTMAVAACNGLPLGLDAAAQALPHLGIQKDKAGHALMLRMSRPRKVGPTIADDTWWHLDEPAKFDDLCNYGAQDVRVEHAILGALDPQTYRERKIWEMDAAASVRGMKLDVDLCKDIQLVAERETHVLDLKMNAATGGIVKSTRAVGQLLGFVQSYDPKIKSLAKDQLAAQLDRDDLPDTVREVLTLRQEAAKSSVAKVKSMLAFASKLDNRMRGLYQYYGAFRTGRDAGRGPQIQNFPRGSVKDQEALIKAIRGRYDAEFFEIFFGVPVLEALSSALRGCVTVPYGKFFCSYDFAQIEARVLPWLAGDERTLDVFRQGRDVYVAAAAGIYGVPERAVDSDMRQIGKVAVLALGFGGGVGAFQSMAKVYGLAVPDEQADEIKTDWRAANPEIVQFWWGLDRCAVLAVRRPGSIHREGYVRFFMRGDHLIMGLPSGRELVYRDAELGVNKFGKDCVTYMGVNQYTRKWERVDTYGGKLAENATQAVARDVMKSAALRVDRIPGVYLLGPVHDELLLEMDDPDREEAVAREMRRPMPWAPGLPIDADGYVGKRFRK